MLRSCFVLERQLTLRGEDLCSPAADGSHRLLVRSARFSDRAARARLSNAGFRFPRVGRRTAACHAHMAR